MYLQHRHAGGADHRRGEAPTLGPQLRPNGPPVVLHRAVHDAGNPDRRAVPPDRVGEVLGLRPGRAGPGPQDPLDAIPAARPQRSFRPARELETQRVAAGSPTLAAGIAQHGPAQGQRVRGPEHGQRAHQPRVQRGDGPPDQAAPTVADDVRPGLPERPDQAGDVPGQRPQVVAARGLVRVAVAAQVDRGHPVPAIGQVDQLVPPGPPELRKPVQQHDQRPVPALGDVQPDPVRTDRGVGPRAGQANRGRIRSGRRPHCWAAVSAAGAAGPHRSRRRARRATAPAPTPSGRRWSAPACGSCEPAGTR